MKTVESIRPECRRIMALPLPSRCCDRRSILEGLRDGDLGLTLFRELRQQHEREVLAEAEIAGWPGCECSGCGCSEPATCTDDQGIPTCAACQDYTTTDDGEVLCGNCTGVETVVESCGAGNQTRTYLRQTPPPEPETDPAGEWACYWETVGDDAHVVSRHATSDLASQAVAAKDWPGPGDHTRYLCGYEVRQLVGGEWCQVDED
jgi:hypothetical protein